MKYIFVICSLLTAILCCVSSAQASGVNMMKRVSNSVPSDVTAVFKNKPKTHASLKRTALSSSPGMNGVDILTGEPDKNFDGRHGGDHPVSVKQLSINYSSYYS